jgi:hypothetical protein
MQPETNYSPDPSLTPAQHRVLAQLAGGVSIKVAAASAGIHRNTVANWRRTVPAFAREFEFAARERSLYWHDQASALAGKAITVLTDILDDDSASPSLRLRAALKVLEMAADPQPEPMKPFPASAAQLEAVEGRAMLMQSALCTEPEPQTVHNPAQPRTSQPGRNTLCPCGSKLKFKRCCALKPPQTMPATA